MLLGWTKTRLRSYIHAGIFSTKQWYLNKYLRNYPYLVFSACLIWGWKYESLWLVIYRAFNHYNYMLNTSICWWPYTQPSSWCVIFWGRKMHGNRIQKDTKSGVVKEVTKAGLWQSVSAQRPSRAVCEVCRLRVPLPAQVVGGVTHRTCPCLYPGRWDFSEKLEIQVNNPFANKVTGYVFMSFKKDFIRTGIGQVTY